MKKLVTMMLVLTMVLSLCTFGTMPVSAAVPASAEDASRTTLFWEDFETGFTQGADTNGTQITAAGFNTDSDFRGKTVTGFNGSGNAYDFLGGYTSTGFTLGTDYTIEMNIKVDPLGVNKTDYHNTSWPKIHFNKSSSAYYELMFTSFATGNEPTGTKPGLNRYDGTTATWCSRSSEQNLITFGKGTEWGYLKIEKIGTTIHLY